jgi:hypothetical protein
MQNARDLAAAPMWIWNYTITFEVYAMLAGPMADAAVQP